jgi:hypothetical protein
MLHGGVCGTEFVEQCQTSLYFVSFANRSTAIYIYLFIFVDSWCQRNFGALNSKK